MNEPMVKEKPDLSIEIIKKYICPKATDQEAYMFMQLCKMQCLNPFLREAYLIKYGDEPATTITGKETFTKRADALPQYDGFKAGIIVKDSGNQATYREGSFVAPGETLLGGWAEVFRKDRAQSFRNEVSLTEYERKKKDGSLMSSWKTMPATMIRKVPLVQSLREAFPDEFGGMYSPEEMPVDASALPVYEAGRAPILVNPEAKPPVTEPQKKAESAEENKIISGISHVGQQTKKKDGTAMKSPLYIITAGEQEYKTFSETFAKVAKGTLDSGLTAEITFTTDKFGNTLAGIVKIEPTERQVGEEG
jgi:phage recombination protein Bet